MYSQTLATIRVGNVWAIPLVFRSLGLDLEPALRSIGLTASVFEDTEEFIPYSAVDELYAIAMRETGCDHIGLLVGTPPPDLGLPGFLMQNAPSVRVGLGEFVSALNRIDSGGLIALKESDGVATISYSVVVPHMRCAVHICDTALAVGYGLLRRIIGPDFTPIEIRLPRRAPTDPDPHRAYFGPCRLRFDACEAAIDFPASDLDVLVARADPTLYGYLKKLSDKGGEIADSIAKQIRRVLPNVIRREEVNNVVLARMFGLHPRTLARRLAEENVTLHELVEEARFEIAQQLLRDTDMQLTEIAADLRYSDASAFTRAFRRKFGASPGVWRKEQRLNRS